MVEVVANRSPQDRLEGAAPEFPIRDDELRARSEDLLSADGHFDRVVREACVILEDRVRMAIGARRNLVGVALMQEAFGVKGQLHLSDEPSAQIGGMELFKGTMAFFRNAAGHHVTRGYARHDAVRLLVWIDLLLDLVSQSVERGQFSPQEEAFLSGIEDERYRRAVATFIQGCRSAGLRFVWGKIGTSIKVRTSYGSDISIGWLFPPGRKGWMGLSDLTLGMDEASLYGRGESMLDEYVGLLEQVTPEAERVRTGHIKGFRFSPIVFTEHFQELLATVQLMAFEMSGPRTSG